MKEVKISALLIVYNEENKILNCLKSIERLVDEIIVIHDGKCSDKTLEIIKQFPNTKIYISKVNVGCCDPHRPYIIRFAKYDYILPIDADERISKNLFNFIKNLKMKKFIYKGKKIDLLKVNWVRFNKDKVYNSDNLKAILLNKNKTYVLGITHFSWETRGYTLINKKVTLLHEHIEDLSFKELFNKSLKWAKIHAKFYLKYIYSPEVISSYNYKIEDFPKKTLIRIKYPILTLFPIIFMTIKKNFHLLFKLRLGYALKKIFNLMLYQLLVSWFLIFYKFIKFKFDKIPGNYEILK